MESEPRSVESPTRNLRGFQFSLRALMIGVTLLACLLAICKEWGLLPASVVHFSVLALVLCWTGRWRQLLSTADGVIWWGGLLIWFSAFPTFAYGPMGGELTQAALLHNVDLSWLGIGMLLLLSGIFLGVAIATLAAMAMALDSSKSISQFRYVALTMWLVAVAAGYIIVLLKFSGGEFEARRVVALVTAAATIIAVTIIVRCNWLPPAKASAVHMVGALSLLIGALPIWNPQGILEELAACAIGYWMYCAGIAFVIAGSAWALRGTPINDRSQLAH